MKLPNGEHAVVPMEKLTAYCLNPDHPVGGHKARVLASALGMTVSDAVELQAALLNAARTSDSAEAKALDAYGQRYNVRFLLTGPNGKSAEMLSAWIVRQGTDFPVLITCYIV